ncbi:DNA-directed RNA polymerase II subunit [Saccharomycopsis crataegensis]|uniref:DNA-directed RNA polymerase II subunit n=1 Tax=Saccharomycopsis crataegensis TaxID=43959 RepID=A0AAV5QRH6_9ASCO|nr:DNA-directed RNA polymerase II subunit [Saccharomycopsis crataegensis]
MNVSTSTLGAKRRRRRNDAGVGDQENAAVLQLGPEFTETQIDHEGNAQQLVALNFSEARILIREALKERKKVMDAKNGVASTSIADDDDDDEVIAKVALAPGANEVLKKTLEYLNIFARFRDQETCSVVESLLKPKDYEDKETSLHPFEIAQLGSLACDEPDEAKTLIPSLADKKSDEELLEVLNQLRTYETPN